MKATIAGSGYDNIQFSSIGPQPPICRARACRLRAGGLQLAGSPISRLARSSYVPQACPGVVLAVSRSGIILLCMIYLIGLIVCASRPSDHVFPCPEFPSPALKQDD